MAVTSSIPPSERGPHASDRLRQVEHWCEVVAWLCTQYEAEYQGGDLRTRLAVYHSIGLIVDSVKAFPDETRAAIQNVNWRWLYRTRAILVHQPWRANSRIVWLTATVDIPTLLAEMRRVRARQVE